MPTPGQKSKSVKGFNKDNKRPSNPQWKKKPSPNQIISREQELKELHSCASRVISEYRTFNDLNHSMFTQALQLRHEPKLVKLDSEFASTRKTDPKSQKNTPKEDPSTTPTSLDEMQTDHLRHFHTFPISTRTKKALAEYGYKQCTRVQHASMTSALFGHDLFILSCTGSGKTLSFIIPVLENLWRNHWNRDLGLGALIIEPTRELALQTFHVLRRIGVYHEFSAGLLIGGTSFEDEQKAIAGMNILICTPGRLIHHLERSSGLDLSNLISLVIDECDHLLDIGFAEQFEIIAPLLPSKLKLSKALRSNEELARNIHRPKNVKQSLHTILLSATTNRQVKTLATKVLGESFRYITLTDKKSGNVPENLSHRYLVVPETEKLNTLFEFLRVHRSNKSVVFVSTARQASFLYELFRGLSIKAPVHRLHSKLGSASRTHEYYQFQQEQYGVLICTDIAARGLDFSNVSWVVHYDCPSSLTQYTHRSGRTARLKGKGSILLMLTPAQERFAHILHITSPSLKLQQVGLPQFRSEFYPKLAQFYSEKPLVKAHAEKAVLSYIQHVIHESQDFFEMLKVLIPSHHQLKKSLAEAKTVSILKSTPGANSRFYAGVLNSENSIITLLLYSIFNFSSYDIIGLCRGYGLQSAPIIISPDLDLDDNNNNDHDDNNDQDVQKKKNKDKSKDKGQFDDDENAEQELAMIYRKNPELEKFIKNSKLLLEQLLQQKSIKNKSLSTRTLSQFILEDNYLTQHTQKQPAAVSSILDVDIYKSDDFFSSIYSPWSSDDDEEEISKDEQISFNQHDNIFEQLKQRYLAVDQSDKQYVKDVATKRRKTRLNLQKLQQLNRLGYKLTLEDLEELMRNKKNGKALDLENFKSHMGDDDSDSDVVIGGADDEARSILDGLGESDVDSENDDFEGDGEGFGYGVESEDENDHHDDDDDEPNEFHKFMQQQELEQKKQKGQGKNKNQQNNVKMSAKHLLDEDSDSGEEYTQQTPITAKNLLDEDSDSQESDYPKPKGKSSQTTQTKSTSSLMGFDSDDDSEDENKFTQTKPNNTKVRETKEEKKTRQIDERREKNRIAKEARLAKQDREAASKRINLNESSSSDDDYVAKKPVVAKKFLNLDETSSDDDDDDDAPQPVVNKNGKRMADQQLVPKVTTAKKPMRKLA
jgi:ATP-dependent RNA helicase DDX10/DBP4